MKHCKVCDSINVRQTYFTSLNPNLDPHAEVNASAILNQGDWGDVTYCVNCNFEARDLVEKDTSMPMMDVDLEKLIPLYEKAVEDEQDVFMYEGQEVLTTYAKYLIEFLKVQQNV
tara:strand:+ start:390 stop:734 length:345 start_codon:yes stop_codon:yes gene_type:complete